MEDTKTKNHPTLPNVHFYQGQLKDPLNNLNITQLHNKRENYHFLESNHSFIQWLFPNHFKSMFNNASYPLTDLEAVKFRQNLTIGKNLVYSYQMIMNFMGIQLKCVRTGQLMLKNQQRLKNVLLRYTHNHLRIMRILACLSTVGFRSYGKQLIKFLQETVKMSPYKGLDSVFQKKWKIYGNDERAKEMCFLSDIELLQKSNKIFEDDELMDQLQKHVNSLK